MTTNLHTFRTKNLETLCPSCNTPHKKEWFSEWWKYDHYQTFTCQCGYKIFLRTEESRSGHRTVNINRPT
jgi:hypothetical protein